MNQNLVSYPGRFSLVAVGVGGDVGSLLLWQGHALCSFAEIRPRSMTFQSGPAHAVMAVARIAAPASSVTVLFMITFRELMLSWHTS